MSTMVDERVLEMKFDNAQFEKAVSQSMKTLEHLDKALTLENGSRGFLGLQKAAETVSFEKIQNGILSLEKRFSLFGELSTSAIMKIVDAITNKLMSAVNEFTIKPITDGFNEYELKMGSIQTIMAGSGETMETVNKYLQELNTYSDKTIYSFKDMTASIGKFTNAGVKLEDAVAAIKGIANEAARSGANANEASRAMYNFSQALSTGSVKLIDWKSIENANMATVEFKETLIDVAESQGMLQKSGDGYIATSKAMGQKMKENMTATKGFNDSLSAQWMTADVLTEALKIYANNVEDMTESEKKAYKEALVEKYGEEKAEEFIKLGTEATKAATEVRTFSMMMDALKEAAASGWATTMELIFGNLEQAKELWTNINNVLSGIIDGISDARNNMLKGALGENIWSKDWEEVTKNIDNMDELIERAKELGVESGQDIDGLIERYGSFEESLQAGWLTTTMFNQALDETGNSAEKVAGNMDDLMKVVSDVIGGSYGNSDERMRKLIDAGYDYATVQALVNAKLKGIDVTTGELTEEQIQQIAATEEQAEALRNLGKTAENADVSLESAGALAAELAEERLSGREHLLRGFSDLFYNLQQIFLAVRQGFQMAFEPLNAEKLYDILKGFHEWAASLRMVEGGANDLAQGVAGFLKPLNIILKIVGSIFSFVVPKIGWLIKTILPWISAIFSFIGIMLGYVYDNFDKIVNAIKTKFVDPIKKGVGEKVITIFEKLGGILESIKEYFKAIGKAFEPVTKALGEMSAEVKSFIDPWLDAFADSAVGQTITAIGGALDGLSASIDGVITYIKDLADYTSLFTALGEATSDFLWKLYESFWELVYGVDRNEEDYGVVSFFKYTAKACKEYGDDILAAFTDYSSFEQLLTDGPAAIRLIAGAFKKFGDAINGILKPIKNFADYTTLFTDIGTTFDTLFGDLDTVLSDFIDGVDGIGFEAIANVAKAIAQSFGNFGNSIVAAFTDNTNVDEMFNAFVNGLLLFKDRIFGVIEEFTGINPFETLIEKAKEFFPSISSLFSGQRTVTFEDGTVMELTGETETLAAAIRTTFEQGASENASFAEKVVATAGQIYRAITGAFTGIKNFFVPIGEIIDSVISNVMGIDLSGIDIIGTLKSDLSWLKEQITTIFGGWIQNGGSLKDTFAKLGETFKEFKRKVELAFKTLTGNKNSLPRLKDAIDNIKQSLAKVKPFIEKVTSHAKKIFGIIKKSIHDTLKKLGKWLTDHIPDLSWLSDLMKDLASKFKTFVDKVKAAVTATKPFGDKVKEIVGLIKDYVGSMIETIKSNETVAKIIETVKDAFSKAYEVVKEFILLKVPEYFETFKTNLEGLWDKFKNSDLAVKFVTEFKNAIEQIKSGQLLEYLAQKLTELKEAIKKFIDTTSINFDGIGGEGTLISWLQQQSDENSILSKMIQVLQSLEPELAKITSLLPGETNLEKFLSFVLIVWSAIKIICGINTVKQAISVTASIGEFVDTLKGLADSYKKSLGAETFRNFALGILAIAAAIFILSIIKWEKMWPAAAVLAGIIVVVGGIIAGIIKLKSMLASASGAGNMLSDTLTPFIGAFKKMATMVGLAAIAFAFGTAFLAISVGIAVLAGVPWDNAKQALEIAKQVAIGLAAFMLIMAAVGSKVAGFGKLVAGIGIGIAAFVWALDQLSGLPHPWVQEVAKQLVAGLAAIIIGLVVIGYIANGAKDSLKAIADVLKNFGIAALLLGFAIGIMSKIASQNAWVTIAMFAVLIGAIGLAVFLMTKNTADKDAINAAAKSLNSIIKTIRTLGLVLALCAKLDKDQHILDVLIGLTILVGVIGFILYTITKTCDADSVQKAAKSIAIIGGVIAGLALVAGLLGYFMSTNQIIMGLIALGSIVILIGGLIKYISTIKGQGEVSKTIVMVAASILLIAGALWLLAQQPWSQLLIAGIALVAMVALLVGALTWISKLQDAKDAANILISIAAVVAVMAIIMAMLSTLSVPQIAKGLVALLIPLIAIVVALVILSHVSSGLAMVGLAMISMATAVLIFAGALLVGAAAIYVVSLALPGLSMGILMLGTALASLYSIAGPIVVAGGAIALALVALGIGSIFAGVGLLVLSIGLLAAALAIRVVADTLIILSSSFEGFSRIINGVFDFLADKLANIPVIGDYFKDLANDSSESLEDAGASTKEASATAVDDIQEGHEEIRDTAAEESAKTQEALSSDNVVPEDDGSGIQGKILGYLNKGTEGTETGFLNMITASDTGSSNFLGSLTNGLDVTAFEETGIAGLDGLFDGGITSLNTGYGDMASTAEEGGAMVEGEVFSSMDFTSIAEEAGLDLPKGLLSGTESGLPFASQAGTETGEASAQGIVDQHESFVDAGEDSVLGYVDGEGNKQSNVTRKSDAIGRLAAEHLKKYDKAKEAGHNLVLGYKAGIEEYARKAVEAARQMAKDAIKAVDDTQASGSPAREYIIRGGWSAQGYAIGMLHDTYLAINASKTMASAVLDAADESLRRQHGFYEIGTGAIAALSAGLNSDSVSYVPTITPIVQMGGATASLNNLGAMRNTIDIGVDRLDTQWSKLTDIVGALDHMSVDTDNSDVVRAINTMRQDIYNLKDAISSMQIVLNKRSIGVIDTELGKRSGRG